MNQPLLSAIVPCYNVEKYIDKCISSIVGQTYSNLEILLVNDGSSDQTGALCDAWQERDARIRVIHQPNKGASYARKTGIENATAEYISFADADDWLDRNMYANMMSVLLSTQSDIAQCGVFMVFEDGRKERYDNELKTTDFEIVGRAEGVKLILDDIKWRSWMWNKIFKKKLFDRIDFPNDVCYEDFMMIHLLFHNASQSVYLNDAYYFYYQRMGSTLNDNTIQNRVTTDLHWASANYDRYLFVKQHPQYIEMLPTVKKKALTAELNFFRSAVAYPNFFPDETFRQRLQQLQSIPFSCRDKIPFVFKLDFLILKAIPSCYQPYRKLLMFVKKLF